MGVTKEPGFLTQGTSCEAARTLPPVACRATPLLGPRSLLRRPGALRRLPS